MTQEQLDYVTGEITRGVTLDQIRNNLTQAGYTQEQITELVHLATASTTPPRAVAVSGRSVWKIVAIVLSALLGLALVIGFVLFFTVASSLNTARDAALEASAKQQIINLRSAAEIHYSERMSYEAFCESSWVRNVPIDLDCVASTEAYRIYTEFESGEIYCIDSIGSAEVVLQKPTNSSCSVSEKSESVEQFTESSSISESVILRSKMQSNRVDAELFYNDNDFSYLNVCRYLAGDHGVPMETDCLDSSTEYRVSAFMTDRQAYWCIDSTGFSDSVVDDPVGYSCL